MSKPISPNKSFPLTLTEAVVAITVLLIISATTIPNVLAVKRHNIDTAIEEQVSSLAAEIDPRPIHRLAGRTPTLIVSIQDFREKTFDKKLAGSVLAVSSNDKGFCIQMYSPNAHNFTEEAPVIYDSRLMETTSKFYDSPLKSKYNDKFLNDLPCDKEALVTPMSGGVEISKDGKLML